MAHEPIGFVCHHYLSTMDKKELRKIIRDRKHGYTPQQLQQLSAAITNALLSHPRIQAAHTILLYASMADEVKTGRLIKLLLEQGKTILLPVVVDDHHMKICHYSHDSEMTTSSYGIQEPQEEAFTRYDEIDVVIVPGLAFDLQNHRLGRGKGYYDHFLSETPNIYKIGICFPFQIVDLVPTDDHDIPMDEVVYEDRKH